MDCLLKKGVQKSDLIGKLLLLVMNSPCQALVTLRVQQI